MNSNSNVSPEDREQRLEDQVQDLSARFPEVHHLSDCFDSVRLTLGLFALILGRPVEKTPFGATADLLATDVAGPSFSLADADKVSKELRELAGDSGVTPVLTSWGLMTRLLPEIVALIDTGYSHEDVGDALKSFGIDIGSLIARR